MKLNQILYPDGNSYDFLVMKVKKIALISIFVIGLLSTGFYAEATTSIDAVTHPSTVVIGRSFEVEIAFNYTYESSCLYGDYIWLFYDVGPDPFIDFTQNITKSITELRPSVVSIEVDTSDLDCAINDTFIFKIRFVKGQFWGDEGPYDIGAETTENYELTVVEGAWGTDLPPISIITSLLLLSIIVIVKKRKKEVKKNE